MNLHESDMYLPGNSEKLCLTLIYINSDCNNPTHKLGYFEKGKWIDQEGRHFPDNYLVIRWVYIY